MHTYRLFWFRWFVFDSAKASAVVAHGEKKRQISQKSGIFMTIPESTAGASLLG
jgi:hypothetical protein